MTNALSRALPAPNNWQDFERLCFDLYSRMWRTNDAEMHGRRGQPQAGVDVYGHDRLESQFVGVQCKGKDGDYGAVLTASELRSEVKKAKTFRPPLDVFIIATTASNDQGIQNLARKISEEHARSGLFEVRVQGWLTLKQRITDHPELLTKYFFDLAPYDLSSQISEGIAQSHAESEETRAVIAHGHSQILAALHGRAEDPLALRITEVAKFLDDGSPTAALRGLERLWDEEAEAASPRNRFRLMANIAGARLLLGDTAGAIRDLRAAHDEDPAYPVARAMLSTAELLQGNLASAYSIAKAALAEEPTAHRAASVLIEAAPETVSLTDLITLIPDSLCERTDILMGLSARARKAGDIPASEAYARRAVEKSPTDWRALSALAEALLEPIGSIDGIAVTKRVPPELQANFDRAVELLRSAWEQVTKRDNASLGHHVAANLVTVLEIADLQAEAALILDRALELAPKSVSLLRLYIQRMLSVDDWSAVGEALRAIPEDQLEPRDRILKVQTEIRIGTPEKADSLAQSVCRELSTSEFAEAAAAMSVEAAAKAGKLESRLQSILSGWPKSVLLRSVAQSFLEADDPVRASLLSEIDKLASDTTDAHDRFHAAEALFSAKQFAKAAAFYEGLHGTDKDTIPLQKHLMALYRADRRRDARELFDAIDDSIRRLPYYAELGVAIYERSGLLGEARAVLEAVVADHEDLRLRLNWMRICTRLGDDAAIRQWLENVPSNQMGRPADLMFLALTMDHHVGDRRSLPIAYRALRAGYGDPQIHLGYTIGLFLTGRVGRSQFEAPTSVGADTAVVLREVDGDSVLCRVLETEADPNIERDEIGLEHPFAKRLIGLQRGDEIELSALGVEHSKFVVAEIQDKYIFAHFRSLQKFKVLFPENQAFGSFDIDERKGDDRFKPLFDSAKQRAELTERLQEAYATGHIPLPAIAIVAGCSAFDVWEAFCELPKVGFLTSIGITDEYKEPAAILGNQPAAVIDPLTLYGLVRLGVEGVVRKCFRDLGVVQTTIDIFRVLLAERSQKRGTHQGVLAWDGEHYRMVELTEELIERDISRAHAALEFAQSLTLLPAEGGGGIDAQTRQTFDKIDRAYLDTVLAAQGAQRVLLCDDKSLRILAFGAGVSAVWTQAVARTATDSGLMTFSEYVEVTSSLAEARYVFTVINHANFILELSASEWSISRRIGRLLEVLAKPTNEPDSVNQVVLDTFFFGWLKKPSVEAYENFVSALLGEFKRAQPSLDIRGFVEGLFGQLQAVMFGKVRGQRLAESLLSSTNLTSIDMVLAKIDAPTAQMVDRLGRALGNSLTRL